VVDEEKPFLEIHWLEGDPETENPLESWVHDALAQFERTGQPYDWDSVIQLRGGDGLVLTILEPHLKSARRAVTLDIGDEDGQAVAYVVSVETLPKAK
jgi:hypothetical protein